MKYGDTLRQRSIPEWGHQNIDYDYLKDLVKHHTTPGTNKAISIPGQGESTEKAFGETFFQVLQVQHDRINLFVASKRGEIERRLDHISSSLVQLQARRLNTTGGQLPARIVERYAKIDSDVTKTGEEIRSLARFQAVQRTGFIKILKKYRRWTKDKELGRRFKEEVINAPQSLFRLDLGHLLDQYIEALSALRSVFDNDSPMVTTSDTGTQLPAARISQALRSDDGLDFDLALNTIPLGPHGQKAVYWIHPDHIVEVRILLLQQMRLFTAGAKSASIERLFSSEDDVALIVLDHIEALAVKHNTSTIDTSEDTEGTIGMKAAGCVRCNSSGKAAVTIGTKSRISDKSSPCTEIAKIDREALRTLLDASLKSSIAENSDSDADQQEIGGTDEASMVRSWLASHDFMRPIAGAVSKRTRYTGLHNNSIGGVWATLDRDVRIKASLYEDLDSENWSSAAQAKSIGFPHAVLEIRSEGHQALSLIETLDRSHLVERVHGFSIEAHALWKCCNPSAMSQPLWIPLLDRDIRKLPEAARKRSRKWKNNAADSQYQTSPPHTSASNTSVDGNSSPFTLRFGESSATSVQEYTEPPTLQAFKKKPRKSYADYLPPLIQTSTEPDAPRYWNEYDNPEDEDAEFYIYVDPNAEVDYPGKKLVEGWIKATKKLLGMQDKPRTTSSSTRSSDDEDSGDESLMAASPSYGTVSSSYAQRSHKGPRHDPEMLHERRTLLGGFKVRQQSTEATKFRLYVMCLVAAVTIDAILGLMTITSRKKEKGAVDIGVLFGTIVTLVLCIVAVLSMKTRQVRLGWVHQGAVLSIVIAVIGLDVLLLLWVLRI